MFIVIVADLAQRRLSRPTFAPFVVPALAHHAAARGRAFDRAFITEPVLPR